MTNAGRPVRHYKIHLAPAMVPTGVDPHTGQMLYHLLTDKKVVEVEGNLVKYVGADLGFFEIRNNHGDIVFTCPLNLVMLCQVSTPSERKLSLVSNVQCVDFSNDDEDEGEDVV